MQKRAIQFAIDVIRATKFIPQTYENVIIIKQLIRSATSVGANIQEALGTNTKKDFAYCMNVAKKESRETRYWLELLMKLDPNNEKRFEGLFNECVEIINMLTKIVKTASS